MRPACRRASSIPCPVRPASSGSIDMKSNANAGWPLLLERGRERKRPPWDKTSWVMRLVTREKLVAPMMTSFCRTKSFMEWKTEPGWEGRA